MSLFQLPTQTPVAWCRWGNFGEGGTWGPEIDASGLETRNRFMFRDTVPVIPNVNYLVRIRLLSTLVASNNGFEGVAARLRGFKLNGSTPNELTDEQVWDSNPDLGGRSRWFDRQTAGYETIAFVIQNIPAGMDYVTVELVVRASGGQIRVHNIECRHLFQTSYQWLHSGNVRLFEDSFFFEQVPIIQRDGVSAEGIDQSSAFLHYATTQPCSIVKGQMIEVDGTARTFGRINTGSDATSNFRRVGMELGVAIRFRVRGQVRFHQPTLASVTHDNSITFVTPLKLREEALENYDQYQVIIFQRPTEEGAVPSELRPGGNYHTLELELRAIDFIKPSQ